MKLLSQNRLPLLLSGGALLLAFVLLLVVGPAGSAAPVAAQSFPGLPNDGRINVVAHFGGDAIYCVDHNDMPTYQYSDFGQGGIRLLSGNGAQLWFVPASDIAPKVAEAQSNGGQGVLVGQGQGTYGPTTLYVYIDSSGNVKFSFTGYDEWGKTNTLEWTFCQPVGPISSPGTHAGGPSCSAGQIAGKIENAYEHQDEGEYFDAIDSSCAAQLCPGAQSPDDVEACICDAVNGNSDFCVPN